MHDPFILNGNVRGLEKPNQAPSSQ